LSNGPRNRLKFDSDPRLQYFPAKPHIPRSAAVATAGSLTGAKSKGRNSRQDAGPTASLVPSGDYTSRLMINPLAVLLASSTPLPYLPVYTSLKRITPIWQPSIGWRVPAIPCGSVD